MAIQKETVDLLLAEGFKELACQQPIEKITIKAITDKAGVIRPTFTTISRINTSFWSGLSVCRFWNRQSP